MTSTFRPRLFRMTAAFVIAALAVGGLAAWARGGQKKAQQPPAVEGSGSPVLQGSGSSKPAADKGSAKKSFTISGTVGDLHPGSTKPLVLTIQNLNNFAIKVTKITTTVSAARPGCTAANLTVTGLSGPVLVPKNGTASATVTATMKTSAPNACKAAVFPLKYSGTAVKP